MGKVIVVTSGKGGVGKTTSTAALGAALARGGENVGVVDFDVGLRNLDLVMGAERRVVFDLINVVQGDRQAAAGADPRQAHRHALPAAGLADPRQGRADGRGRRARDRRTARALRLGDLRQPGRHRARRDACDALRRRGGHRRQSGSLLGARFRSHHRPSRFQDRDAPSAASASTSTFSSPDSIRCAPVAARCSPSRTCSKSSRSRSSASFPKARRCCAHRTSARR